MRSSILIFETGLKKIENLLKPVQSTMLDSNTLKNVLTPIRPMCWDGPYQARMKGLMNVPEPSLPYGVPNLQFKRQFDGRESIRFNDSVKKETKNKNKKKSDDDKLWKSLRSSSRSGMY